MKRARIRFWLAMLDVAHALRAPLPVYLWIVARASNATDWGPPLDARDGEGPW
jgi:hypothetical protein